MKRSQMCVWKRSAKWADEMENACVPFRRLFSFFHNAKEFSMIQRLSISAALSAAIFFTCNSAQAQFGGVQVQVGGYGTGVRIGNLGYSNGLYGGYGNGYGNGYGYANPYNGNYGSQYGNYSNGGYYNNGYGYNNYPNAGYTYVAPRYYAAPIRSYPMRRYRYR